MSTQEEKKFHFKKVDHGLRQEMKEVEAKSASEAQGDRSFWQNFLRKFHFEIRVNNLLCKLYTENPTRKAAYFSAQCRELVLTKERPASEIIDYHFKLHMREFLGKLTIEDWAQHNVLLMSAACQGSPVYNKKIENQYAATLDMKIIRQLKSSLSTPTEGMRRKNSTLSEEIEQKFIIRAHTTSIQSVISPIVGVYLLRLLEKLQRASLFDIFSEKVAQSSDIKNHKKMRKNKGKELDDIKKLTASFIHAVDALPERIARCEMVTNNLEELDQLQLKKAISRGMHSGSSKKSEDSSDEEDQIPGLITDIELHLESAVLGYIIDMPEKQPNFSWINLDSLLQQKEKSSTSAESIHFEDLMMDQYVLVVNDIHIRHQSSLAKPLWASIQGLQVNRFSLVKEISLSRNESLENKDQKVIQENSLNQQARHIGNSFVKINDDSSISHEDKFYSIIEDSMFLSIKDRGLWTRTNLIRVCGKEGKTLPTLEFHMSVDHEGDSKLDIVAPYRIELNLNTVSLPLDMIANGWMSAFYQADRCLHLETISPRKDFFMNQETKLFYQGLDPTQLVHFFYDPLNKALQNGRIMSEIANMILGNSGFESTNISIAIKELVIGLKALPGDNELLESTLSGVKLSWDAPKKNFNFKIQDGIICELIEDNAVLKGPTENKSLLLLRYRPESTDTVSFCKDFNDWNFFLNSLEVKISLVRLNMLTNILSVWREMLGPLLPLTSDLMQAITKTMAEFDKVYNHFDSESTVFTETFSAVKNYLEKSERKNLSFLLKFLRIAVEDDSCKIMRQCFLSKIQPVTEVDEDWYVAGGSGIIPLKDELKGKNDYWQNKIVEDKTILSLELDDIMALESSEEPGIIFFSVYAGRLQDGFTSLLSQHSRGQSDVEIIQLSNDLFKGSSPPSSKLPLQTTSIESLGSIFYQLWQDNQLMANFCRLKLDKHSGEIALIVSPMAIKHRTDNLALLASLGQILQEIGSHALFDLMSGSKEEAVKSGQRRLIKINLHQVYVDLVDEQNYRLVLKLMEVVAKLDISPECVNGKVDLKCLQAFSTNDQQAIHKLNCYHMLDDPIFCRLALMSNLSATFMTPNDCGETEIAVSLHTRDSWDIKGLEIFINPVNIIVISGVIDYFGELGKVLNKLSSSASQDQSSTYLTNKLQGAKRVNARKQTSRKDYLQAMSGKKSVSSSDDSFEMIGEHTTTVESIRECLDCKLLESAEGIIRAQEKPTCTDPLREESKLRFQLDLSKAHVYIFCEHNYSSEQHLEARINDLAFSMRKAILGSSSQTGLGSETTLLLAVGGFNILDKVQNSIFQYVLETPGHPLTLAINMIELDIERYEIGAVSTSIKAKRKTSESMDTRGVSMTTTTSRKISHDALELSSEFTKEKECKFRFTSDDLHNLKLVITIKPLHLYLSESSTDLLINFYKSVQKLLSLNAVASTPVVTPTNAAMKPACTIDYIYISDIQLDLRTSSKSLLTPVKYFPELKLSLPLLFIENKNLDARSELNEKMVNHYMVELTIQKLIKSNAKNLALVSQLFKASHALLGIYRFVRYRNREVTESLVELQDFVLWNLCKAGELGASVFSDFLHIIGRLLSLSGYDQFKNSRYFDKLEKKIFLLENGQIDSLKY